MIDVASFFLQKYSSSVLDKSMLYSQIFRDMNNLDNEAESSLPFYLLKKILHDYKIEFQWTDMLDLKLQLTYKLHYLYHNQ